jgi:Spy/CpxP family protein refolding chaperone
MHRAKQQAAMFLLGALLVGGALGFSADRYIGHQKFAMQYGPRQRFYDQLGLTQQQRNTLDSLAFQQDCVIKGVLAPEQPKLDSIRASFRAQWRQVFTKEQLARYDEIRSRHAAEQAKEPRRTCSGN